MPSPPTLELSDADAEDADGLNRRTLVRILIGLGIGIPVLVEAVTFFGLLESRLGGSPATGTDTPTPVEEGVGVGDELLPATEPTDTVADAAIDSNDWRFTLVVEVTNDGDRTYELLLDTVTTDGGTRVDGGGASGPIPPGESGSVTGTWQLPEGATPRSVEVVAVSRNGTTTTVDEQVPLRKIPLRG